MVPPTTTSPVNLHLPGMLCSLPVVVQTLVLSACPRKQTKRSLPPPIPPRSLSWLGRNVGQLQLDQRMLLLGGSSLVVGQRWGQWLRKDGRAPGPQLVQVPGVRLHTHTSGDAPDTPTHHQDSFCCSWQGGAYIIPTCQESCGCCCQQRRQRQWGGEGGGAKGTC